jgi:hypothetical protein
LNRPLKPEKELWVDASDVYRHIEARVACDTTIAIKQVRRPSKLLQVFHLSSISPGYDNNETKQQESPPVGGLS